MKIEPRQKGYPVTAETVRELIDERDGLLMEIAELKNKARALEQENNDLKKECQKLDMELKRRRSKFWSY